MNRTKAHTGYQRSNSEQLEVNVKLFSVIRKRNISTQEKIKKIKKLLGKKPQPDINAQDGNDNWNSALHLAIERNELELVNFLLSEGADTAIENGDGKTALQLAEERNHAEIIDALKSCTSQIKWPPSQTDRLPSHNPQTVAANPNKRSVFHSNQHAAATGRQTASTVLPPFSGELKLDKELILSNDDFKQSIMKFYDKKISAIDQLKTTPAYPAPHILAQFANMAYDDYQHREPKPPDGWQLLTTASHFGIKNGYFGTAYWHPERQQVVIAHRGTDIKNVGALVTDVKGVLFNNYVDQMSSSSTFANKVVAVLQEIEQEKKVSFELFFTGHSLGGWLAQITTFTTEYLEVKSSTFLKKLKKPQREKYANNTVQDSHGIQKVGQAQSNNFTFQYIKENADEFLKKMQREEHEPLASSTVQDSHDVRESYHPHTVVFESPGCETMLLQMKSTFDLRCGGSIDLQHLDITSYLSAPNRINTCNSHLGTVYRIFTDLSDMGILERHTPLYNLATHSMEKIKEAFDPETGKGKDDKGEQNILVVVDWPVSAGLTGGAELNDFFKWAKQLNNYHPAVMDSVHSKVPKGYHLLRYQTKTYDKCTKGLSIFTQDEREFLERYRWLRNLPDFFKPEDLFCVMNNGEAEKQAEQNLRDFELDNEKIRCTEAGTLHALIPYVKRLVQLFPHIKKNVKDQLSSAQIRNRVYQHETKLNVTNIINSTLDFNPGGVGIREFLASDRQIWQLRMIDGDAWTGISKVYRVLQNMPSVANCFRESQYTILKLKRLLMVHRMINLNEILESIQTPHLMFIACGTNQFVSDEVKDLFKEMFNIVKQKNNMKIILTTQSEDSTAKFVQQIATETLGEGFITTDEQLTWSDLTADSQTAILEKTVIFQGRPVALNQLTSAESMTDSFPLVDLFQGKKLRIGKEPVVSAGSGYNEKYYIDRTFNHNIVIRQDISIDKGEGKFADLLASSEQEFKQLCQQSPKKNVHWLEKEKSGELIWQRSQGNFQALRKYTDKQKPQSYAPSDLDKLLQQARNQRVIIIADTAGMGKTTVLTHLSKRIKQKYPAHWLVRIDLNDYTEVLKDQKEKMDKGRVLEFVSKEVLKLETYLEKELFKKTFEGNEITKVVVMVDGFDEISPSYKQTALDMLQVLKQTSLEQLWVTTRPHLKEELEDNLQQLSYTLQPFSEFEQVEFLQKFWIQNLNLEDTNQHRLQIYAKSLIRKLAQSISDKDKEFTGIPLQTRMLAEAFEEDFVSFYLSEKSEPEFQHKLDLLGLYRQFIDRKYDIYYLEKSKTPAGNMAAEEQRESYFKWIQEQHQLLALEALFTEDQVTFLKNDHHYAFSDEQLARIGIVQRNSEGKPQFIHRTFAEYYVAEFLIKQLTKKTKPHPQVQELLLNEVLLRTDYRVIGTFLDGFLENSKLSEEVLKDYGDKLSKQWNVREVPKFQRGVTSALHSAAAEDNVNIIGFLLDSLKSGEHSNTIKMMLLAKDDKRRTAWHKAAANCNVQALKKIWEWVAEMTPTLIYSLLLSQNRDSKTAWQLAAEGGHTKVVEKLWDWAKEIQINQGELRNELLLGQDSEGRTVWHVAAQRGNVELIDKLWVWTKKEQLSPSEIQNKLFLGQDSKGRTAWHAAAQSGSVELINKLWGWAKMLSSPDWLKNKLLLFRDQHGINAWHLAAMTGSIEILAKLWDWAEELQLETEELRNELLLSKDKLRRTAWHMAAGEGHVEVLEKLWDWATTEKLNPDYLKCVLFLSEESRGYSTWRCAEYNGHINVLQKMWGWAEELHLTQNLLNKLLLTVDKYGNTTIYRAVCTGSIDLLEKLCGVYQEMQLSSDELSKLLVAALHRAAAGGYLEVLDRLWLWAGEVQRNPQEVQRRLLLDQNKNGETVWHMAVAGGHVEILEKLWGWAKKEKIKPDYLKSVLFLPEDSCGFSTWCYAIREVRTDVIQKLWGWAEELQLTADELKNKLFLAVDRDGNSAIYWAAGTGSIELLETLWGLSKEMQINPNEFSNMLLAAWHEAAAGGYLGILERLWLWAGEIQINPYELKIRLLLEQTKNGASAWHVAAAGGHTEVLEKLWGLAKGAQINRVKLKDKSFLDEYRDGRFAWQLALREANGEVLDNLLGLSEEVQMNASDIRSAMLQARDRYGKTAWHLAVRDGKIMVLKKLLELAKELQLNPGEVRNKLLLDQKEDGRPAWSLAAKSKNVKVLEEIWVLTKEKGNPEEIKSLLLAQNEYGQTALHVAADSSVVVLEKLWAVANETQLNLDELQNKLLLAKDKYGNTAWHRAAEGGNLQALETLWSWAKEVQIKPDELLLAENKKGETAFHLASEGTDEGILQKMWILAKEEQVKSKEIKNKLLLFKDKYGNTAWHRAAKRGHLEALETLWNWAKETQLNTDEILLAQIKLRRDPLQVASQRDNLEVLEELWVGAKKGQLNKKELKKTLILGKNKSGKTALHISAEEGYLELFEYLYIWAKEAEINPQELLLARTRKGSTAFGLAALENHVNILEKLWAWAEEAELNSNELKNKLFLDKDKQGFIPWHLAALGGSLEALESIRIFAKVLELNTDELLLAESDEGETAFHCAAHNNRVSILQKLWVWAKDAQLKSDVPKKKIFLAKDSFGYTAWHRAALRGNIEALQTLWIWAKEAELIPDELLLAQSLDGETAFHCAAEENHVETLKKLWVWAEEAQLNTKELKKKLLLGKEKYGYTAWHLAEGSGSLEALRILRGWSKEAELNTDELLLAKTGEGFTAFELATENSHVDKKNRNSRPGPKKGN